MRKEPVSVMQLELT